MTTPNDRPRFYKTTVTFVVLSDGPTGHMEVSTLAMECDDGGFVALSEDRTVEEVAPDEMSELLVQAGSEPEFFGLGDDDDEEDVLDSEQSST